MRHEFLTYEQFEREMLLIPNFTFEYLFDKLNIFFEFNKDTQMMTRNNENYIRQPLFSIGTKKAFEIIAPSGFRLIQFKAVKGFETVEKLAIKLANTPICKRKNRDNYAPVFSNVFIPVDDLESIEKPSRDHAYITPDNKVYVLDSKGLDFITLNDDTNGNIDLTKYAKKPEDVFILDQKLKEYIGSLAERK